MSKRSTRSQSAIEAGAIVLLGGVAFVLATSRLATAAPSGERATCASRLADVSAAALMYSSDFDGRLVGNDPSSVDNSPGAGLAAGFMDEKAPRNWAKSIMPYLDNGSVLRCPSEKASTDEGWSPVEGVATCGYLANGIVGDHPVLGIPEPGSLILFQEEQTFLRVAEERPNRKWDGTAGVSQDVATRLDSSRWSNAHELGGNLVFCDGHGAFRPKASIRFTEFGISPGRSERDLCSDGKPGQDHFMVAGNTEQEQADLRQNLSCPTDF